MFRKHLVKLVAVTGFLATSAMAQDPAVTLSDESGVPGDTVAVNFTFESNGTTDAGFQFVMSDETVFASIDLTNCLQGNNATISSCVIPGANPDTIRITLANDPLTPLTDFTGTILFEIDGAAAVPQTIDLVWDTGFTNTTPAANVVHTDGSVELLAGPPAVLDVTPPNINFGTGVAPTTLGPQTVTIANAGTAGAPDLTVNTLGFSGADAAQFSTVGGSCAATPFDLAQGASCTVDIELDANAVAVFTADFDVDSSVGAAAVALTGEGTAGPQSTLTITPNPMAFGVVDLGTLPVTDTFVAENTGDAGSSLTISAFTLAGDPEFTVVTDGCSAATLNAGDTCSVEIQFDSAANGVFAGTGSFASDANTGANQDIAITGEADSVADLQITPPFGPVNLGAGPAGSTVSANGTVVNNGSAAGTFDCSIGGPDAAVFSVTPDLSGGITVDPGDTADFVLACDLPGGAADGDVFNATLTCAGDLVGTHELSCSVGTIEFIPVPTMQPWALALFALMMLIVGGFSIRFFRAS